MEETTAKKGSLTAGKGTTTVFTVTTTAGRIQNATKVRTSAETGKIATTTASQQQQ